MPETSKQSMPPLVRCAAWLSDDLLQPRWLMILFWTSVGVSAFAGLLEIVEVLS